MLACSTIPSIGEIKYPVLASPKLDGIRCVAIDGVAYSRTMKKIPNAYIQRMFKELNLDGLDGELMLDGGFESVASMVMSVTHERSHAFYYNVFDCHNAVMAPFTARVAEARERVTRYCNPHVRLLPQLIMQDSIQMTIYLAACLDQGFEGAIVRDPKGPYKQGRSTMNQGWMLKLKIFKETEATIMGFEELLRNEDTSTNKNENMVPADTLGALVMAQGDMTFKIGSGFNTQQRDEIWQNKAHYIGKRVTYKYQELTKYGKPRFPTFKGVRLDE